jgi:hypothetical protein
MDESLQENFEKPDLLFRSKNSVIISPHQTIKGFNSPARQDAIRPERYTK